MQVSPPVSDDLLLQIIIQACSVLTAASVLVWLVVFFVRARRLRLIRLEIAAEERLTGLVLDQISGYQPDANAPSLVSLSERDQRLLLRVLRKLIDQTRGQDQLQLVHLLRRVGFLAHAIRELRAGSAARRHAACSIVGLFDDEESLAALARACRDRDPAVRLTAIEALLVKDRLASLRGMLADLAPSREDPSLSLAELFSRLPARLHPEAIQLLADDHLPVEWRRMLAIALGRKQVLAAYDALAALRKAPSPRIRAAAWIALAELGDPRAGDFVEEGLRDAVADVREAACRCAGRLGGPPMLPVLLQLLSDPEWWVRYRAACALLEFGREGRRLLEARTRDADPADAGWQALHEPESTLHAG